MAATTQQPGSQAPITGEQLGQIVRKVREMLKWSQETLAELSGITVRTIQRIEKGEPSSVDTRRALAQAFGLEDIDAFNKPMNIPSEADLKAEKERREKEYVSVKAVIVQTGRELAAMSAGVLGSVADAGPIRGDAEYEFASMVDLLREYADFAADLSEVERLEFARNLQDYLDSLKASGYSICCAVRKTAITNKAWGDPTPKPVSLLYVSGFTAGEEPETFLVHRKLSWG